MISVQKKPFKQQNIPNIKFKLMRNNQKMEQKQNVEQVKPQSESPFSHQLNFYQQQRDQSAQQNSHQKHISYQKINLIQTKNTSANTIDQIYSPDANILSYDKKPQPYLQQAPSFHQAKYVQEEYIFHQNILKTSSELQESSSDEKLPLGVSTKIHQHILDINNCSKRKESTDSNQSQPRKRVKKIFEDFKCAQTTSSQRILNRDLEIFKQIQKKNNNNFLQKYSHYVFQPALPQEQLKQHLISLAYNLNQAIQYNNCKTSTPSRVYLPNHITNKKTLLLDLDETLVHLIELPKDHPNPQLKCRSTLFNYQFRPFVLEFIKKMSKWFEIGVFTAGDKLYAEFIVDKIDKERTWISFVLDKAYMTEINNGVFVKNLLIFQERELKNIILIDNMVQSFANQIDNGIPIFEWTGNCKDDQELKYLAKFLKSIKDCDDVRIPISNHFRLGQFLQDAQKFILENQFANN